jgi:hypothetical protein
MCIIVHGYYLAMRTSSMNPVIHLRKFVQGVLFLKALWGPTFHQRRTHDVPDLLSTH